MRAPEGDETLWHPVTQPEPVEDEPRPLRYNWFGPLDEVRRGRRSFEVSKASHWFAAIAIGLVVGLVVLNLAMQIYLALTGDATSGSSLGTQALVAALLVNMVLFIGAPVLWVSVMYYDGKRALRERLFLRSSRVGRDLLVGLGAGVLGLVVSYTFIIVFELLGWTTENPVVEDLGGQLTWALVLFIPFAAATSEEVFFRAFLQPRYGAVPANVFFGAVHLSYQTPLQVIVPMALGFILSATLVRRRSLLPAVVAHFVFNFVALTLTKLAFDFGWGQ